MDRSTPARCADKLCLARHQLGCGQAGVLLDHQINGLATLEPEWTHPVPPSELLDHEEEVEPLHAGGVLRRNLERIGSPLSHGPEPSGVPAAAQHVHVHGARIVTLDPHRRGLRLTSRGSERASRHQERREYNARRHGRVHLSIPLPVSHGRLPGWTTVSGCRAELRSALPWYTGKPVKTAQGGVVEGEWRPGPLA